MRASVLADRCDIGRCKETLPVSTLLRALDCCLHVRCTVSMLLGWYTPLHCTLHVANYLRQHRVRLSLPAESGDAVPAKARKTFGVEAQRAGADVAPSRRNRLVAVETPATQTVPRGGTSDRRHFARPNKCTSHLQDTISCIHCVSGLRYPPSFTLPLLTQDNHRTHRLTHRSRARHSRNGSLNTRSTRPPCTFIRRPAGIRRRNHTKPPTERPNNAIVDQRRRCAQLHVVCLPSCCRFSSLEIAPLLCRRTAMS
jgi:hypothetical protein